MSKEIELTQGYKAIVDDKDYEWLSQWKWRISAKGYAYRQQRSKLRKDKDGGGLRVWVGMARLIMGDPVGMCVDHINGNKRDNRRCNLRICTLQQNLQNAHKHKGLYKGVYEGEERKKKGRSWVAMTAGKHLGVYSSPQAAARAYDRKALELFGEFAHTNFPEVWYRRG